MDKSKSVRQPLYHNVDIDTALYKEFQPILLCNFKKLNDMNEKIHQRYVPDNSCIKNNLLPPRPSYTGPCLPKEHTQLSKLENPRIVDCCNTSLCPGTSDPIGYFSNIEIESYLRNIHTMNSRCPNKIYRDKFDCNKCQTQCNIKEPKIEIPNSKINKCVAFEKAPKCKVDDSSFRFETLYDYSDHVDCNLGCQKVWNNRTKKH